MITRPLDLASRLQPLPRSFDPLFYVNVALIVFFFTLFSSPYVLAPGLVIPRVPNVKMDQSSATDFIDVFAAVPEAQNTHPSDSNPSTSDAGISTRIMIYARPGLQSPDQLRSYLQARAKVTIHPSLSIRADARVSFSDLAAITDIAQQAGFVVILAEQPSGH